MSALTRKEFQFETRAVRDSTIAFTISTAGVDRQGDVIDAGGWDLSAFRKNPVVLWAHDYDQPPIGRAVEISAGGGRLTSTVEFMPGDLNPFAGMVYRMVVGGWLRSASVGFRPIESSYNGARGGVDYKRQELLEWSIVPVPANAEALVEARAAGVDLAPLTAWAKETLARLERKGGKPNCPRFPTDCEYPVYGGPNTACPAGSACPLMGHAPAVPPGDPRKVLIVDDAEPLLHVEDGVSSELVVTASEFRAMTTVAVRAALSEMIGPAVEAAVKRHSGRVD